MSATLLVIVLKMLPPETDAIASGKEAVARSLRELGLMTGPQKRLPGIAVGLLLGEKKQAASVRHHFRHLCGPRDTDAAASM